jgi:hypothetical protein
MAFARFAVVAAAAWLLAAPAPSAQFAALDWTFDGQCGTGSLEGELMHVLGCDYPPGGIGFADYFHASVPYAGTVFTRVDFFNHDIFWGIDATSWQIDGATYELQHNYEHSIASLVFDVPSAAVVGLGIDSGDGEFGPGEEDLTKFHYFPDGVVQTHVGNPAAPDFGRAVASTGDVDGDGVPDLLVGAPGALAGAGRVQLLSGLDGSVLLDVPGAAAGGAFGTSVDAAGDVNGDHVPDLLVGAPGDSTAAPSAGAAYLLSGADGTVLDVLLGDAAFDRLGESVAGLGDANGDGVPDVAAGAPLNDAAGNKAGLVRVVSGADGSTLRTLLGTHERDELGTLVARVGDADGDGRADLLLGIPLADAGALSNGEVRIVGVASGETLQSWAGTAENEQLGSTVAGPGDVDGDGLADVLLGSPNATIRQARVQSGSDGSLLQSWDLKDWVDLASGYFPLGPTLETSFGDVVAAAGDVDDDGVPDLLVRGQQRDYGPAPEVEPQAFVFVFSGRDGDLLEVFAGPPIDAAYAAALSAAGDLDGDGRGDVLIGRPNEGTGPGAVETITVKSLWANLGFGLAGVAGAPHLAGLGLLAAGTRVGIALSGAAPSAPSYLVVGAAAVELPFAGGTLVPAFEAPLGVLLPLATDASGGWSLQASWPAGLPAGLSLWFQAWTLDATAPVGKSASNALRATIP